MSNQRPITDKHRKKQALVLICVALAFVAFYSITVPYFFTVESITNIIRQSSVMIILAMGMTFVILMGSIDLSVGSNIAISGVVTAIVINATGGTTIWSAILGIVVAIATSTAFGLLNGVLVGRFKINSFMATMATQFIGRGLTLFLTNGTRIVVSNETFNALGSAIIPIGGFGFPAMAFVMIPVVIVSILILERSRFGRMTYAAGGNPLAAIASGINYRVQSVKVFGFMGLLCGIATIITIGRASSAQPTAGQGIEFDVITAVVLGGISLAGGKGSIKNTLLGTLIISVLYLGINMIDTPIFFNTIIKGAAILFAIIINDSKLYKWNMISRKDSEKMSSAKNALSKEHTLVLKNVSKYFPGVQALKDVTFEIKSGQVHAIAGENGAGKSTLIKILSGVYRMDDGEILLDGQPIQILSPSDAKKAGISVIYQELALVPELSVPQNVYLGKEQTLRFRALLNIKEMRNNTKKILSTFNLSLDMNQKVSSLAVGKQQMVEIAKAVSEDSWVVVMDEPTSAISEADKQVLFQMIQDLKAQGVAIVYITHRMQEIFEIADEVTVLRDGKHIVTVPVNQIAEKQLIRYMVDRDLKDIFSRERTSLSDVVLRVENLYKKGVFEPISFEVRAGEVLGMGGLIGAGRTEICRCIFGLDPYDGGEIYLNGKKVEIKSPSDALGKGIAYVSEDRRMEGIFPDLNVKNNITMATLREISRHGFVDHSRETALAHEYIEKLRIKTSSDMTLIGNLSGGNQQKACLAKMMCKHPKIMILDEPTRGIDVGAKAEIHKLIEGLAKEGIAIILISSELPELIGSSDRIVVLFEGLATAMIGAENFSQEEIMKYATTLSVEKNG